MYAMGFRLMIQWYFSGMVSMFQKIGVNQNPNWMSIATNCPLLIHIFFTFFMFAMFLYYEYAPQWYWIQIIYYLFATTILLLGLSWIASSVIVFFKDMGQLVAMLIQFGFWLKRYGSVRQT
jgi:ABC-type polysaccharide/polyol phosphate export permease